MSEMGYPCRRGHLDSLIKQWLELGREKFTHEFVHITFTFLKFLPIKSKLADSWKCYLLKTFTEELFIVIWESEPEELKVESWDHQKVLHVSSKTS